MTKTKDPVLVCLQLSGGNDFMSTVVPYGNPLYYDYRQTVGISEQDVIKIDNDYGFHPSMGPIKNLYDRGDVAVISGIGYSNPDRSHFRSMDIWHTAEPDEISADGWLGRTIREIDPSKHNVVTGVSFGTGLPRAMYLQGTPAISVSHLEGYVLLTSLAGEDQRQALNACTRMYAPIEFDEASMIMHHIKQTGRDAMTGADILNTAPPLYSSTVEYAENPLAQSLKGIAQVHLANLGTRIFYAQIGGFDVHGGQMATQAELLSTVSTAVADFFDDLREHESAEEVIMLIFTEFGRRVKDNGNGTDHGSGGGAFLIGENVRGGMHSEYPSLDQGDLLSGDLKSNHDFRSLYSTILQQWMGVNPSPIVNGHFDQFDNLIEPLGVI